jgi:hypothetical protein
VRIESEARMDRTLLLVNLAIQNTGRFRGLIWKGTMVLLNPARGAFAMVGGTVLKGHRLGI